MSVRPLVARRVTVGLPTYNRANLAVRAAQSVLAQTYPEVELVVSDDFSTTDDSEDRIEALRPLAGTKVLRIERQPHWLGLVRNFDACLRLATGEFFLLLGDDDVLEPTAIERLVHGFLHRTPTTTPEQVGLTWSPCSIVDATGARLWTTTGGPPVESPANLLQELWSGNRGPRLSSMLMRTTEALAIGGFEEKYGDLCDIATWAQAALRYPAVLCVPEPLVQYTNHQRSVTSQSSVEDWQDRTELVHKALLVRARAVADPSAERIIARARAKFLGGITLTILMQIIGEPGWMSTMLRETRRRPDILLGPDVLRRVLKDGWKAVRLLGR